MSTAITQAAISYFGLPEATTLVEGGPVGAFAFVIPLTEEHLRGIADRMKALAEPIGHEDMGIREELRPAYDALSEEERVKYGSFWRYCQVAQPVPYEQTVEARLDVPTREQLRARWNVLTPAQQGRFGSFGRYCTKVLNDQFCDISDSFPAPSPGVGGREVQHVDAPVGEAPSALPDAVWVPTKMLTADQRYMASAQRTGLHVAESLIQVVMLTDDQRAKYAPGSA